MELKEVKELLEKYNQEQLLKYYDELNEAEQKDLLRQISEIDFSVLKFLYFYHTQLCNLPQKTCKTSYVVNVRMRNKNITDIQ